MEVRLLVWEMERNKSLQHQLADLTIESLMKEWAKRMVGVGGAIKEEEGNNM